MKGFTTQPITVDSNSPRFDRFDTGTLDTLEKAIQLVDPTTYISTLDYAAGTISVGKVYNPGTDKQFAEPDFVIVNVACDSVSAAFHDVYNAVYSRCI